MRQRGYDYWTITYSFAVLMGAIALTDTDGNGCTRVSPIDFHRLASEWKLGLPSASNRKELSPLDLSEIRDKSKSSNVVKTLACFQAGWLVIQCIGRRSQGLQITTLEIITIAYTMNAFLVYWLWWNKPLDIEVPIKVKADAVPSGVPRVVNDAGLECDWLALKKRLRNEPGSVRLPEILATHLNDIAEKYYALVGMILTAMAFGAIHAAAWNNDFTSLTEKLLWRICSVVTVAIPVAVLAMIPLRSSVAYYWLSLISVLIYSICRLYLIVEPFVSLRSLPADAYDTIQWSNLIPHIF
ncbi:MAG: hypothetical protein M1840_005108 [Geoglossum simile]|nr:MAG: hypothetical protein M1840_005108 [Geoglossum simile]